MKPLIVSVVLLLALAAPARADVLVNAPDHDIPCGGSIRLGVWYRDHPSTGHRAVVVEVRSARGFVLFRRHLQAPPQWKFWSYKPLCGRHYRVRYTTFDGVTTFRVWVRRG
jgi:hypothetical protein